MVVTWVWDRADDAEIPGASIQPITTADSHAANLVISALLSTRNPTNGE
jgi:hypothetical protein